ncbi:MAG: hypothetical protein OXR62_09635 [Ahrensia sp.]|nr:hypothetical protein [Ahrensia sp.]
MAMIKRVSVLAGALLLGSAALPVQAGEKAYFRSVAGSWAGVGHIAAGPYKNTRFTCKFSGTVPASIGMQLDGTCRVGVFPQTMKARIVKRGSSYTGRFSLGTKGDGLDITSGKLRGKRLTLGIRHKKLTGTFQANLKNQNSLNLTIAVKVQQTMVPFIGLTLTRTGPARKTSYLAD